MKRLDLCDTIFYFVVFKHFISQVGSQPENAPHVPKRLLVFPHGVGHNEAAHAVGNDVDLSLPVLTGKQIKQGNKARSTLAACPHRIGTVLADLPRQGGVSYALLTCPRLFGPAIT